STRDREELAQVLPVSLGDGEASVLADDAREISERLVQLSRREDQRVVAQQRERGQGLRPLRVRAENALHARVQSEQSELPGDHLLGEGAPPALVLELHELV